MTEPAVFINKVAKQHDDVPLLRYVSMTTFRVLLRYKKRKPFKCFNPFATSQAKIRSDN